MITTDFGGVETGYSVALQSDGKILVTGGTMDADGAVHSLLARYNVDGSLDSSFSGDGKVIIDSGPESLGVSVAVQNDGKILVSGAIDDGNAGGDFSLMRFNANGSLDTSFSGDGIATTDFGGLDVGFSVATQSDGKIIVAGNHDGDFALARYNSDGNLDASFSGDGMVTTDFSGTEAGGSVVLQGDGKILVAGVSLIGSNWNFAVARYNANGSLDTTFSGDGKVLTDFGINQSSITLAVQADGKIVVAGGGYSGGLSFNGFGLVRYNSDGTLDTSFSGDGVVVTDFGGDSAGQSVKVQADGRILVGGFSNGDFAMVRYNSDGTLDTSFSGDGKVTTDIGGYDGINGIAIQGDGRIVAVGVSGDDKIMTTGDVALARYNVDGTLDTGGSVSDTTPPTVVTFSPVDGATGTAISSNIVVGFSEAIQNGSGTIAIHSDSATGTVLESYNVATSANLSISGSTLTIDPTVNLAGNTHYFVTFDAGSVKDLAGNSYAGTTSYDFTTANGSGKIITDFGGTDYGFGMAMQIDGKMIMTGTSNGDFALARYNQNGSLDTTFDTDGKVTTDFGGYDGGFDVAVQSDGKFFAVGNSDTRVVLAAYNGNGSLNTSFGTGGKVTTDLVDPHAPASIALQSDGKILVAGEINGDFALARYTVDGTLDTTFAGDGEVTADFGHDDGSSCVAVQSNGKILVAGSSWLGNYAVFALVRYNSNGSLDAGFGTGGKVTTLFSEISGTDQCHGIAIQSDGKILVTGAVDAADGDVAVARYNVDGTLDTTFSGDGKVATYLEGGLGFGVTVQSDGKILVAGYANQDGPFVIGVDSNCDFALVRYNSDGTLDTAFGGGGKVVTDFGGTEFAATVALQSDGKIVLSGYSNNGFALARYNPDGSLDASFNGIDDTTAPTVSAFNPADGGINVAVSQNIAVTFSEDIHTGSGTIVIHSGSATGTPIATFDVATSTNLSVSGHTLTINPTADLAYGTHYFVTLDPGSIKDLAGNSYAGTSAYDFTTEQHVVLSPITAGSIESWEYFASYGDLRGWALLDGVLDARDSANSAWHYNTFVVPGIEARSITFDAWEYLASNPDLMNWLAADGLTDADAVTAAKHYIQYGFNEGRLITFDSAAYLAATSDLQHWINDLLHLSGDAANDFAARHYISFGRFEPRPDGSHTVPLEVSAAAVDEAYTTYIDLNGGEVIETQVALSGIVTQSQLPAQHEFAGAF